MDRNASAERRAKLLNNGKSRLEKLSGPKAESSSPTKRKELIDQKHSSSSVSPTVFSSSPPPGLIQFSSRNSNIKNEASSSKPNSSSSRTSLKSHPSVVLLHKRKILFGQSLVFALLSDTLVYWFVSTLIILLYCWVVDPATRDIFKHVLSVIKKPLKESIGVIIVLLIQQAPVVKVLFVDFVDSASLYIVVKGIIKP